MTAIPCNKNEFVRLREYSEYPKSLPKSTPSPATTQGREHRFTVAFGAAVH